MTTTTLGRNFTNNNHQGGYIFISTTQGAQDILVWNDQTGVALITNAQSNGLNIKTDILKPVKKTELKNKIKQLQSRGYDVQEDIYIKDNNSLNNLMEKLIR